MTEPLELAADSALQDAEHDDERSGFGCLSSEKGALPLRAMDVHGEIAGLFSHVTVKQAFVNTLDEPVEATYIFPLPDRAAVSRFVMKVGEREVSGVLQERAQARRNYEQALEDGYRAAIAEEDRSGVFTLRVGNLLPGDEAEITLELSGPLPYTDGEATFRFPLVVAPRYIPGTPLPGSAVGDGVEPDTDDVPDASRISPPVLLPGYPNPVRLSLSVTLDPAGLALDDLRSSLHSVVTEQGQHGEQGEDGVRRVELRPGERLNRDFILRFRLGGKGLGSSLVVRRDEGAEAGEGTFLLTLVPPAAERRVQKPRDVVFVLDRSGSMAGWKMVAARRAVSRMVDTLGADDQFNVYAFDNTIESPPDLGAEALHAGTDRNRFRAVEFLARTNARGGTEMANPLKRAVDLLARGVEGRDRILVLITDGQVGNEDQILRHIGKSAKELRVFTLGIDRAVNAGFLKRLAELGGGTSELVESEERLDEVMYKMHRTISTPVLSNLRLESQGLELAAGSIVPARLPDVFAGSPTFIQGRFFGEARGGLRIEARSAGGERWTQTFTPAPCDNKALTLGWARGRVRQLEDEYAAGEGRQKDLAKTIVDTSLRFGVLSRFTAFVAIDRSQVVNQGGEQQKILQPVEMPDAWEPAPAMVMSCGSALDLDLELFQGMVSARRGAGAPMRKSIKRGAPEPRTLLEECRLSARVLLELLRQILAGEGKLTRLLKRCARRLAFLYERLGEQLEWESRRDVLKRTSELFGSRPRRTTALDEELISACTECVKWLESFLHPSSRSSSGGAAAESDPPREEFWA